MSDPVDLSFLERPEILEIIFPVVYSPVYNLDNLPLSPEAIPSYNIEVEEGIKIACGFWESSREGPSILYFHGNGETAASYEWFAPYYNQRGINLFVADYRGYGSSNGQPTVANVISDARTIFSRFMDILEKRGFKKSLFVMGRSLGSLTAIEVALNYQDDIYGVIIESGTASNFRGTLSYLGIKDKEGVLGDNSLFLNKVKIKHVHKPTLIIHGSYDQTISVEEGKELYQSSGAKDKEILVVDGAGHNDVMVLNQKLYFDTITNFIQAHS